MSLAEAVQQPDRATHRQSSLRMFCTEAVHYPWALQSDSPDNSSLLAHDSNFREDLSKFVCDMDATCSSSGTVIAPLTFQLCFLMAQWQEGLMVSSAPNQIIKMLATCSLPIIPAGLQIVSSLCQPCLQTVSHRCRPWPKRAAHHSQT